MILEAIGTEIARRFVDAQNAEDTEAAAQFLAEDVAVVFPQGTVSGRAEWKKRRGGAEPSHMQEQVEASDYEDVDGGVELVGRYVVRWRESGEVADEQPVRIRFEFADGLISRLEFLPS